ncbi:transmembrane protein, putative (macronuclear) [Tetrahymena thermophila SB210]|uniref:Transmembrane protein, putative n=1 Tax=Tetrahymena thermophila (strain SB210) TaxID=312017 RepID=Q23VE8_TETTS|nr:transmembrane protein, putative [Tetrahymena thermophila SB210]EAS00488.2 transmembrane protein, putative [Tetrahymena thermophila SB210]|eukprot:XP_001020733.2 transmembrane protein, putative [Tetrahymena thermophila SB210]
MEVKNDLDNFEESEEGSQKFKFKVFYVMDKMIDFYHNSMVLELSFLIIQTFQIIGLIDQPWMRNSQVTSSILDFMQMFLFVPFYTNNNSNTSQFQILLYFCSAFVLVIVMSFVSTSIMIEQNTRINEKQKSSHKIIFSLMDFIVNAMTQVLYIPFFQLFCSTFRCEKNTNNQYSATQSQNTYYNTLTKNECFAPIQIPNFTLSIICMVLLHGFSIFINKMYFDTRLDCTYKNSKISGVYELNLQYFVSNFCILIAFFFEDRYQVIKVILSIVWWFNLLKLLNDNMIYNLKLFSFLKLEQAMIIFWTSLIGAYNYFFPDSTVVVFFWVVGIIFLTIYNFNYEPVNNDICAANSSNYRYVQEAIKQLRVLCYAISKYDQYSLKVDGFLNRHRNDCNLPNCPSRSNAIRIKKFNRMLVNQTTNEDLIMSIFVIYTIFNNNILKFGGSNQIRLLYALFLLETIQNKDQSLIQISFLLLNQPSLEEQFIVYRLKRLIMQLQNHKDYKKLDFSSEFTIDEYSSKFKKILSTTMQNFLQFWQELLEPSPQADNLLNKGYQLIEQISNIQSQFDHLSQQRSLNQSAFRCYQAFSLHILEDKEHFEVLQKQTIDQNEQIGGDDEGNLKEEDTYTQGILVISSQEENFANIIEVNLELLKTIGFLKSQVLSKNVSILIPNIWQQYHNQFIDQYLASGQKKIIGQQRELFIKSRSDYSLPIKLNIKIIPSHTQGLLFQAQIVAQNLLYDYPSFIIANVNGQIDTISPSVISMFNIDMKKVKQGMFIEKIIPNFWEYILDFQEKQGKELIIKTYQLKMMKETKVKIFVQQIRFMNLGSQGYIIKIKLTKSDLKSLPTIYRKNQTQTENTNTLKQSKHQKTATSLKDKNIFSEYQQDNNDTQKQNAFKNDFSFLQNNSESVNNQAPPPLSSNLSSTAQKKLNQLEIFYDIRTNTYQGVIIAVSKLNNQEELESDTNFKKQQKSIFSYASPTSKKQSSVSNNSSEKNFIKQQLYPFIYTFVRSNEERVKDILDNNKSAKQKPHQVDNEVQNILENLIKMQYDKSNNKGKLSSKSQKKSKETDKNGENILPSVYVKPYEIERAQEEYLNKVEYLILQSLQVQDKADVENESSHQKVQKDYGESIKTLRLENNKLIDLKLLNENEDQNSESSNQNLENNQQILQEEQSFEGEYQKELDEIILSKKNIKSFMKDSNFNYNSSFFTCKKLFSLLFLVFEIVYISVSLVLYQQQCNDTITRFQMYNVTHLFYANTQHIIEGVFNMFAIDKGVYYNFDNLDYSTAEFYFQKYLELITMYQFGLDEILTKLYLNKVGVTQQMQDIFINNRNIKILIHFIHRQTTVYPNNLYQASQQVLAKVYHFKRVPLGQFDYHNNDIYINVENFSNQLLNQIIQYRDFQEQEIFTYLNSMQTYTQDILYIGLLFILGYLILVFILYLKTLFCFYEIPSILTTIPLSQIRNQIKVYEQFLTSTLIQEEEENQSNEVQEQKNTDQKNKIKKDHNDHVNIDNQDIQDTKSPQNAQRGGKNLQTQTTIKLQKNLNSAQNQDNSNTEQVVFSLRGITSQNIRPVKYSILNMKLLVPFFFSLIFFSVYMIVDTNLTQNFINQLQNYYLELTYSVKLEPDFMLLFNCLKSQTQANNYVGVRQVYEPIVYFQRNINSMYDLMDNFTYTHYNNYNILPASYQTQFDQYFSKNTDICSQLYKKNPQNVNQTECNLSMNGQINEGMNININHLITHMITYAQSIANVNIQLPYKHSVNQDMYQVQLIMDYMKIIMRELNDLLINGTQSHSQTLSVIRIAICISICSILISICLFVSIPLIQQIKSKIFNQRQIFSIIPIHLLSKNRHIRQYILKQYLSNNKK